MPDAVVLSGQSVRLEPLGLHHVDGLVAAAAHDRTTYGLTSVPGSRAATVEYIHLALEQQRVGQALPFAVIHSVNPRGGTDGTVVGSSRFLDLQFWQPDAVPGAPASPSVVEIGGTWLAAAAQRTHINTEAKLLMLTHAFEVWRVHRVSFKTDVRNTRSRRAIERLGAQFDGVLRAQQPAADGGIRDSAYYSIIAAEWPQIKAHLTAKRGLDGAVASG